MRCSHQVWRPWWGTVTQWNLLQLQALSVMRSVPLCNGRTLCLALSRQKSSPSPGTLQISLSIAVQSYHQTSRLLYPTIGGMGRWHWANQGRQTSSDDTGNHSYLTSLGSPGYDYSRCLFGSAGGSSTQFCCFQGRISGWSSGWIVSCLRKADSTLLLPIHPSGLPCKAWRHSLELSCYSCQCPQQCHTCWQLRLFRPLRWSSKGLWIFSTLRYLGKARTQQFSDHQTHQSWNCKHQCPWSLLCFFQTSLRPI